MPIYERSGGFMVSVGSGPNRYREAFRTRNEAEVAELEALARQKASGSPLKASTRPDQGQGKGYLLQDAHELSWRLRWSQDKDPETHRDACRKIFRDLPAQTPLSEITPDTLLELAEKWEDQGNSGSTVNRNMSHLSVMLKEAKKRGWIASVPDVPKRREGEHRIRWLSDAEEVKLLNLCAHLGLTELHDFIVVALDTGFRRGELLNLTPRDYMNGMLHLWNTKTGKPRAVPVTQRVAEILEARAENRKVFKLSTETAHNHWQRVRHLMELSDDPQFVIHMLRHTCASRLVQRGVPLAVVKDWMGHTTIMTTMRYAHLAPSNLQVAREALEQPKTPTLRVVNG